MACNSASSNALDTVKTVMGTQVPVIDVVQPVVNWVATHHSGQEVALVGTRATMDSGVYQAKLAEANVATKVRATPLLATAIEEGFHGGQVSDALIAAYLESGEFNDVHALILGCTHYPLVANQIAAALPDAVALVDSAEAAAQALKRALESLADKQAAKGGQGDRFMVSDLTESFSLGAQRFFAKPVDLVEHKLPSATG